MQCVEIAGPGDPEVLQIVYRTFPLHEAAAAHRLVESSEHIGKIALTA